MAVLRTDDAARPIRFALTSRPRGGTAVEIVLHLYRGSALISQTVLDKVERQHAGEVLRRCRSHIGRKGFREVAPAPSEPGALRDASEVGRSLQVAAFDWMFQAS